MPETRMAPKISPYNTARMPTEGHSLAEALKAEGYVTAHSGKWHISKHHYDYPTPFIMVLISPRIIVAFRITCSQTV